MKKIIKIILILILFSIPYALTPMPSFAQQVSLSLSPPLLKLIIKPGKSVMVAYKIENSGDPTIMSVNVLPFEPRDNIGNIRIKDEFEGPIRFSLDNADLQMEQPFILKTQDNQQILLRIRIPDGTPEGDYYYTFFAETQPSPLLEGAQNARAKATIGSNILITVSESGTVDVKGKIALFDVLPRYMVRLFGNPIKIFDSSDKIPIVLIVDNKGNNMLSPEGQIILKGNFGEKANYDLISQNVLAQSQRLISASNSAEFTCPTSPPYPTYCKQPVSLLLSGFFLGLYRVSTMIAFGENTPQIFANTSFLALPFKMILGFCVAIFIGIIIIYKIRKRNKEE